eukprot:768468-Hanusia_phi.AAC.5
MSEREVPGGEGEEGGRTARTGRFQSDTERMYSYGTGTSSVSMAGSSIPPSFMSTGLTGSTGTLSDQEEDVK